MVHLYEVLTLTQSQALGAFYDVHSDSYIAVSGQHSVVFSSLALLVVLEMAIPSSSCLACF